MDPSTGTFTSMDTYGGSLEDPMSLHKYLFANSNPVKWCDPSGHSVSLEEAVGVCAIIGALAGMDLYVLGFIRGDDEITFGGLISSAVIGAVLAIALFFLIYVIAKLIILIIACFIYTPNQAETIFDNAVESTESIWDKITATAENIQATEVPATFQVELNKNVQYINPQTGTNILWTNANATEHIGEYISRFGPESSSIGLRSQIILESYYEALNQAMEIISQLPAGKYFGVYGNWEFGINTLDGSVYHAFMMW